MASEDKIENEEVCVQRDTRLMSNVYVKLPRLSVEV